MISVLRRLRRIGKAPVGPDCEPSRAPGALRLEQLEIASPCPVSWESMQGDERVRFCQSCQLHVYNLAGMTRGEATNLLESREGRTCVRMMRRADGTVLTRDCPVGLRFVRRQLRRTMLAAGALLAAILCGTLGARARTPTPSADAGPVNPWGPGGPAAWGPFERLAVWIEPPVQTLAGAICMPPQAPSPPASP